MRVFVDGEYVVKDRTGVMGGVRATCTGGQRMAIERLADMGVD